MSPSRRPSPLLALPLAPLLLLAPLVGTGCTSAKVTGSNLSAVEVQLSEVIPTVAGVGWSAVSGQPQDSYVEFGLDDSYGMLAPATLADDGSSTATVLGMKPGQSYHLRAVDIIDGEQVVSEDQVVETGSLPSDFPSITVQLSEDGHFQDGFLVTTLVTSPSAAIVLDPDGDIVWWYAPDGVGQMARARLSQDGQSVLMMPVNVGGEDDSSVRRVSLDGTQLELYDPPDAHHDFVERDDGSIGYLTHDPQDVDGVSQTGDSLTVMAPDGSKRTVWSVWDDFAYEEPVLTGGGDSWSHANSLQYRDGSWYVGFMNLSTIVKVSDDTGALQWALGGSHSDFHLADGGTDLFVHQHQFEILDDSILVFDNGTPNQAASMAIEYSFHEDEPQVEQLWSYDPDPSLFCFSLGIPIRFDNGNTLIDFSTAGEIDEVTPDGSLLWKLSASLGGAFGYMEHVPTLYNGGVAQ